MAATRHAVTPRCATAGFARRFETSQRTMLKGCMPTTFRHDYVVAKQQAQSAPAAKN